MDIEHVRTDSSARVLMRYSYRQDIALKRGYAQLVSTDGETYLLTQGEKTISCRLAAGGDNERLRVFWQMRSFILAYLEVDTIADMEFHLWVTPFPENSARVDYFPLALSETVAKSVKKYGGVEGVAQNLTLRLDDQDYLLLLQYQGKEEEGTAGELNRFSLVCSQFSLRVRRVVEHGTEYYEAYRLDSNGGKLPHGALTILRTSIRIGSHADTRACAVRISLDALRSKNASYLNVWQKYRDAYMDLVLEKGRKCCAEPLALEAKGTSLTLTVRRDEILAMEEGDSACLVSQLPVYMEEANKAADRETLRELVYRDDRNITLYRGTVISIKKKENNQAVVHLNSDFAYTPINESSPLALIIDVSGDLLQLQRQYAAYESICQGYSANCFLSQIIEKESSYAARPRKEKIPAESPFVKSKLFSKRDLTPNQKEAVELALNTPDIVLIQGPPGTGKTTVITAILERLNELQDKTRSVQGEVLVTSFQHDAVENVIERLSINNLPTVKFGSRSSDDSAMANSGSEIRNWSSTMMDKMLAAYPELELEQPMEYYTKLVQSYAVAPSPEIAQTVLTTILSMPQAPSEELKNRIKKILSELLVAGQHDAGEDILPSIYALRTSPDGYADDGRQMLKKLIDTLENANIADSAEKGQAILDTLKEIQATELPLSDTYEKRLMQVRLELLALFSPRTSFNLPKPRADILGVLEDYKAELEAAKVSSELSVDAVRRQFYNALKYNPESIKDAVEGYCFVYAATNQQALGRAISDRKREAAKVVNARDFYKRNKEKRGFIPEMYYSTVVVDEAAKSAPPDLMIAMALARQRIILVGDHRQLPHMVDEAVCKQLEENGDSPDELIGASLEDSMFAYLKERLENLERKDGIKRTITLQNQYRTHPILGEMVSRYFYEPYGEGYRSPLPAEVFTHHLPDTGNSPCVWLDVTGEFSITERSENGSLCNKREAFAVVSRLKKWMDSPEGANMSFGVISFYKAQIHEIKRQLAQVGIADVSGNILPDYKTIKLEDGSLRERLRIGTVDSFQGMEFDVVILSMVRKKGGGKSPHPFGFLECANRLCVALSRQKRMLAIAGDSAMADSDICRSRMETVAILAEFYDKCKENNSVIPS